MPRNGSGTYTLPAGNPVQSGTTISSTVQNNTMSDIATALTESLTADGQKVPTANLPMGGYKHTGVDDATDRDQYAATGQVQDGKFLWCGTAGGTADVITASVNPPITAYVAGQTFRFVSSGANTTNVTINLNGVGAKAITKLGANALAAGDIPSGAVCEITYDGTQFQLKNIADIAKSGGVLTGLLRFAKGANIASATTVDLSTATGNTVHITGTTPTSAVTMGQGLWMECIADAAWPLTYHATNLKLNTGGANYTCSANDRVFFFYDGTTVFGNIVRQDGKPVITPLPSQAGNSGKALVTNGSAESWGYPAQLSTASGSAPSYAARAFVNFDGTGTVSIRAAGNVSSITDSGVGTYALNFSTPMPDANYVVDGTVGNTVVGSHVLEASSSGLTSSICNVLTSGGGTAADFPFVSVVIFR